ncbi:hypothetical protein UA08_02943 [Talaromyces atroroseus]|uniref:PH domain-containing protein n=1 Tax=Talaromyces atroroseus TaxID=1441469 RepID=A0A225AW09_TALAT|nr:hypothetical protein UA08_02943 [Talaromyces atroroseus]OKL62554.1 hypothetical protein UA08_02943 [Talaromyces atroroseus]
MDPPQSPPKSAIPRRGPPLTAIRTDLAQQRPRPVLQKPRPQRLRPTDAISDQSQSVPLQPDPAKRQASKTSLRSLFARNKALRDEKKQDATLPALGERRGSATPSTANVPDTPRSIAYTVASGSTLPTSSQAPTPTESSFRSEQPSRAKPKPEPKSKVNASWVPPPLFQAYPQALKHARLSIPNISADSILRIQATQGNNPQQSERDGADPESADRNKKEAKDKKTGRRGGSSALGNIILLSKIFVLVTAGYILQYAGEGGYDRLPEKVMRLGPASAAFASDAIPGKPYVLQISQKSSDDGKAPATGGRTFLSRFGLQGAESRRTVRTFLVIMASPQEMNSWLIALRKAIESLGGKKYIPEYEGDALESPLSPRLATRNSRLFVNRKSSLRESNPPSPLFDTFQRRSPVPSVHRKNSYQDDISTSSIKTANRRSLTAPSDAMSISTATSTTTITTNAFKDSDAVFENPRDPPLPTHRIKITPSTPAEKPPVATPAVQPSATAARQLRRPTPSVAGNGNRRSYIATQSDSQGETFRRPPSLGRPLSFTRNTAPSSENSSAAPQNHSVSGSGSRLSMVRKNSAQMISSNDKTLRQIPRRESPPTVNGHSDVQEKDPGSKTDAGSDSSQNRRKRQSLVSPSQSSTPATSGFRSIPTILPRKYSLTGPEGAGSSTPRYYRQSQSPDLGSASRLPQTLPQPSQSRLPSAAQKSRQVNRIPKLGTESEIPSATGGNLARFALGNDRASKVSAAPVTAREIQSLRSASALSQQARKISKPTLDEQQQAHSSTPASSPQTPGTTPREESSRRSSLIAPQSQQTSPRQRRIQNLSLLPPAPPPDCPLPEVPPNIALRHTPAPQRRQQQQQQKPQLPRPSLPSSTLSTPPPSSLPPTPNVHMRRRSSELRYLHQQMANILTRKQSDASIPTSASSSSSTTPTAATAALPDYSPKSNSGAAPSESPSRS